MKLWHLLVLLALLAGCQHRLSPGGPVVKTWRENPSAAPVGEPGPPLTPVAFAPDGKRALSRDPNGGGELALWDLERGRPVRLPEPPGGMARDKLGGHEGGTAAAVFTPNGKQALTGGGDQLLKLWDLSTGRELRRFAGHQGAVTSVAVSRDGGLALSGSADHTVKLWDVATGQEVRTLTGHSDTVSSVAFSPDGELALSGSWDTTVKLWEVRNGQERRTWSEHTGRVVAVSFSPDGTQALSAGARTLLLWSVASGRRIEALTEGRDEGHSDNAVAFTPDCKTIVAGGDGGVRVWDVASGTERLNFMYQYNPDGFALSPDGRQALVVMANYLVLFDVGTGEEVRTLAGSTGQGEPIYFVAFTPDGKRVFSAAGGGDNRLWDVDTGATIWRFQEPFREAQAAALSPDGRHVLIASFSLTRTAPQELQLWDLTSGQRERTFADPGGRVLCVAFSPDGRYVLSDCNPDLKTGGWLTAASGQGTDSARGDNALKLWDVATGRVLRVFERQRGRAFVVAFAKDGKRAVTAGLQNLQIWDVSQGRLLRTLERVDQGACQGWSADGRFALMAGKQLWLWDLANGEVVRQVAPDGEDQGGPWRAALSRDGKMALAGRDDGGLVLLDLSTGRVVRRFVGQGVPEQLLVLAFSADEKRAVSGAAGASVKVWDVATGREIRRLVSQSAHGAVTMIPTQTLGSY